MKFIDTTRTLLAMGCWVGVSAALAGEIVLFESPNFQGYSVTYNGDVENLGGTAFNDRTSSISVRQGLWEVCVDAWYEGGCLQLAPGLYPQLNPPFYRTISSLREIGGSGYTPPVPQATPAPPVAPPPPYIELYDREYFQGSVMAFQNAADNLGNTGFNDQAASISVRSGTWEVCYDAYYQGGCMQLPPGDYPRLDPPFVRSISSLRPIGDAGWAQAGGYAGSSAVVEVPAAPVYDTSVAIAGATIGVTVASYPELVPVPGYPVYYAPGLNANYFFYDGLFWIYQRDNWYSSTWYNGPWVYVAPSVVPLYVLRVPVSYYRRPPPYFYGWRGDAPPRWGDHWGPAWTQARPGWDRWDRRAVPPPAPLPFYQRPYAGDRYPRPDQQRTLLRDNYRYQPKDAAAIQQFHGSTQPGRPSTQPPRPPGQSPATQPGGPSTQPPRPPGQQGSSQLAPMQPGAMPPQTPQQQGGGSRPPRPASAPAGAQPTVPSSGMPQPQGMPQQGGGGRPPSAQVPAGGHGPAPQSAPQTSAPQGQRQQPSQSQDRGGGHRAPSDGAGQGAPSGGDGGGSSSGRGGR